MHLKIHGSHTKDVAADILTVRLKLHDGSHLTAQMEDFQFVFKTELDKESRIFLSEIARMKNLSRVVILRKFLWANKFEIYYHDGSRIIAVPQFPATIHLNGVNAPHAQGDIALWKIEWLKVLSKHHIDAEVARKLPATPARWLNKFYRLFRYFRIRLK